MSKCALKYVGTPCVDFSPIFEKHKALLCQTHYAEIYVVLKIKQQIIRHSKLEPQFITLTLYRVNIYVHHNSHIWYAAKICLTFPNVLCVNSILPRFLPYGTSLFQHALLCIQKEGLMIRCKTSIECEVRIKNWISSVATIMWSPYNKFHTQAQKYIDV